jgi:cell division protein DivIC
MQKLSENTDSVKPLLRRGLGRLPSWLKNKYLLTGVFFAIWMVFFDQKDILSLFELRNKQNGLEISQTHLKQLITDAGKEQVLLKTSVQGIEKYAREKFMMKKDNEDLFIVKPAPENK